jgi:hypothetical protein
MLDHLPLEGFRPLIGVPRCEMFARVGDFGMRSPELFNVSFDVLLKFVFLEKFLTPRTARHCYLLGNLLKSVAFPYYTTFDTQIILL